MSTAEPDAPSVLPGRDGRAYYTLTDAATRIGVSTDTVRRELTLVPAQVLTEWPRRRGRPPSSVVDASEVDLHRERRQSHARRDEQADENRDLKLRLKALYARFEELDDDYRKLDVRLQRKEDEVNDLTEQLRRLKHQFDDDRTVSARDLARPAL